MGRGPPWAARPCRTKRITPDSSPWVTFDPGRPSVWPRPSEKARLQSDRSTTTWLLRRHQSPPDCSGPRSRHWPRVPELFAQEVAAWRSPTRRGEQKCWIAQARERSLCPAPRAGAPTPVPGRGRPRRSGLRGRTSTKPWWRQYLPTAWRCRRRGTRMTDSCTRSELTVAGSAPRARQGW